MGGEDDKIVRGPGDTLLIKVSPDEEAYRKKYLPDAKKLTDEKLVCTVCSVSLAQNIHKGKDLYIHRALQVLVCEACYNFYGDGCFSADEDGDDKYCRWCGQGGTLYLCSACNCAFCQKCTKQNLKASVLADLENDDWKCYICNPRPVFGCRTICWGAQQLNKIGKEKEQERLKKVKERLEKLEAKKKEKEVSERKSRKASSSEDEASAKKRKRSSGDSSSPEVMPKRKKREASRNLNGSIGRRRRGSSSNSESENNKKTTRHSRTSSTREKIVHSSSEDESDYKSKKEKLKKKKKRKGDSDDASDTGKKKSKRRPINKKDSSDDDTSEDEKLKSKKKLPSKKRTDSTDSSSDEKAKKKKLKKRKNYNSSQESSEESKRKNQKTLRKKAESTSDRSSDEEEASKSRKKSKSKPNKDEESKKQETADSDSEQKKSKKSATDTEEVNTISAEDILVKKRIKLAILWLTTIVKDISELGSLISLRATNFSRKKINTEKLKSYEDVLNCVSKVKQLISGVHSNYDHIEKTLESHLKPWKILTGLEDADNEKNHDGDSAMAIDGDVSKANDTLAVQERKNNDSSQEMEVNGTLEESKGETANEKDEETLNNWSDDSDDQNETRALITKANESLDKSQIEDMQSETGEKSLDEKNKKSTEIDDKSIHVEKSTLNADEKESKERSEDTKRDSVQTNNVESKLPKPNENSIKDSKDSKVDTEKSNESRNGAESDNENGERSPKKSSPMKNNSSNEKNNSERSEAGNEKAANKEEIESEGDKENKPLQSDLGTIDYNTESSEDSLLESFTLRLKSKWQSGNTTEEMNLKQSLETDLDKKEERDKIPKVVVERLKVKESEVENECETTRETEGIKKKEKFEDLNSDNEEKNYKKTPTKRKVDKPTKKQATRDDKSNCLSGSDEEDEQKSGETKSNSFKTEDPKKTKDGQSKRSKTEDTKKTKDDQSKRSKTDAKKIKEGHSKRSKTEDTKKTKDEKSNFLSSSDEEEKHKSGESKSNSSKNEDSKKTKYGQSKRSKTEDTKKTRDDKSNCLSSSDEEEKHKSGETKNNSSKTEDPKKTKDGQSKRSKTEDTKRPKDDKSNCLSSSDEEEVQKSGETKSNNSKTEDPKKTKDQSKRAKTEDTKKTKDQSKRAKTEDTKKTKDDHSKMSKTEDSRKEKDDQSKKSKTNDSEKTKDDHSKRLDSEEEEKESDDNRSKRSIIKNKTKEIEPKGNDSEEESKVNNKETKSNDQDVLNKQSKEDIKQDEESDTENDKTKPQKNKLGSKAKIKSKLKDYSSDEEGSTKNKRIKLKKSKESKESKSEGDRKAKNGKKNETSCVSLDSSDGEQIDTVLVENGAESNGEKSTCDVQENAETNHTVQEDVGIALNNEYVNFALELQAGSTENTNDIEMAEVIEKKPEIDQNENDKERDPGTKDEEDSKGNKTKFVGLDSSSDEEIKVKKKSSPKRRPVRKEKKSRNVLVLSSDDEEEGGKENPVHIDSSDEDGVKKEEKDEDYTVVVESSADSSDSEILPRNKRKKTGSSDSDASITEDDQKKQKKRRRIKCADSSDESRGSGDEMDVSQKNNEGESPAKGGRKNIKKIKKKGDLEQTTIEAAEEEKERRKRIEERQKLFNQVFEVKESAKLEKLVLDFDPETKKELISVNTDLVAKMKPHQAKGVKFMWDSCFESVKQVKKTKGSGCILAHCMGLGKTFQVISLIHTLITHEEYTKVRTVMVVCPLSTVLNWVNEFAKWLEDVEGGEDIEVFHLTKYNKNPERARELRRWQHNGGVLVMGYEMFRNLTNETTKKFKAKMKKDFLETLIDPGADLIVCDEGHMLKNEATALSKAMTRVRTLRRIVLTGTPMQNNLKEYHCMVQFVKPNLLGTSKEFLNRFVNPINNGQFVDSTDHDVKLMKRRAHVLHKMLEGLVQRFDYNVLTPFLPPKQEYVISVCLSELQEKLYSHYLENESQKAEGMKGGTRLFMDWQTLGRVWTHPRVLKMSTDKANWLKEKKALEESDSEGSLKDFIDDDSEKSTTEDSTDESSSDEKSKKKNKSVHKTRSTRSTRQSSNVALLESSDEEKNEEEAAEDTSNKGEWWSEFIEPQHFEDMRQSGKLLLLFAILKECELIEDKVLVFSQSLFSLDMIEYFLDKIDCATQEGRLDENLDNHQGTWSKGLDYFRLDGSTSSENRNIWCKAFNREDNPRARLFLISTRAGGLGINLTAANRVIIFDASWNPSHDIQSIFRIYRFGQKKPCYVYRFVAFGTMEEKVYERQVAKQSISNRVVDEQQVHRHFSMNDLTELYSFTPASKLEDRPTPALPRDPLMAEILSQMKAWIEKYHEHDSLLENVVEEELNEEERKAAWEDYENDKKRGFMPPAGPQGPTVNPNAAWNQQIEIMRQQLKLRYADKSDEEINSILVYQVSILMRQQQQQQMQMAAQMQAANNMGYRPQMYGNNMMGGFNQRPQMQTTAYLRNIAPKPSSQQPNYTPDQVYRMQQQANLARLQMQQQQMAQKQGAQAQQGKGLQSLLAQQLGGSNYPTANIGAAINARAAAELQRMKQNYQESRQKKPGVTITEITDKPSGSSES